MYNIKSSSMKRRILKSCMYILAAVFSIGQLFPLVWLIDFSLCKSGDLFGANILKWPDPPQWQNYVTAWVDGHIFKFFINSLIVNIAAGFFTVLFSLMMGYALTRMEWKFRKRTLAFILLGLMIPIHATLLPNYKTFEFVGISDSYLALIIPYIAFSLPLGVFLMTGFMETIPRSVEEAAVIDGCGIIRIVFLIILPMVKPAVMTISIMTILNTWNEFIMAATYLSSDTYRTLPFAVYNFAGQYISNYSVQFAVMNLVALPSLLVYIVLNEHITKGATAGAMKS